MNEGAGINGGAGINAERVKVLSMEYQSLRSDLQMRSSARFQFLGLVTAAAAVLATGLGGSHSNRVTLVLEIAGAVLFGLGLISFWLQGKDQAIISAQIASIETKINKLVQAESGGPDLLRWETINQKRSLFDKWVLGLRLSAKAKAKIEDS